MQAHPWMLNLNNPPRGHGVLVFTNDDMVVIPSSEDIPDNFQINPVIDRQQRVIWLHAIVDNALNKYPLKTIPITDEMMYMNEAEMLLYSGYERQGHARIGMGDPCWLESWVNVARSYTCECIHGIHKLNPSYERCPKCGAMYEYRSVYLPDFSLEHTILCNDFDIV